MAHPTETPNEARQAEKKGWVSRVLVISTVLAIVVLAAAYFFVIGA